MDVLWDSDDDGGGGGGGEVIPSDDEGGAGADTAAPSFGGDDDDDGGGGDGAFAGEGDALHELALIDTHVLREEVLARIERVVEALLEGLMQDPPRVPPLELQSRRGAAAVTRKRLFSRRDGASCVRLWRVLAECHANLTAHRSATQRELYCACPVARVRCACFAAWRRGDARMSAHLQRRGPHACAPAPRFPPLFSCQTRLPTA
jgi:hypothetical protein